MSGTKVRDVVSAVTVVAADVSIRKECSVLQCAITNTINPSGPWMYCSKPKVQASASCRHTKKKKEKYHPALYKLQTPWNAIAVAIHISPSSKIDFPAATFPGYLGFTPQKGGLGLFTSQSVPANQVIFTEVAIVGLDIASNAKPHGSASQFSDHEWVEMSKTVLHDAPVATVAAGSLQIRAWALASKMLYIFQTEALAIGWFCSHLLLGETKINLKFRAWIKRTFSENRARLVALCLTYMVQCGSFVHLGDTQRCAIFEQASFLNHSCEPNAILLHDNIGATLVSLKPIAADEELTISYTYGLEFPSRRRLAYTSLMGFNERFKETEHKGALATLICCCETPSCLSKEPTKNSRWFGFEHIPYTTLEIEVTKALGFWTLVGQNKCQLRYTDASDIWHIVEQLQQLMFLTLRAPALWQMLHDKCGLPQKERFQDKIAFWCDRMLPLIRGTESFLRLAVWRRSIIFASSLVKETKEQPKPKALSSVDSVESNLQKENPKPAAEVAADTSVVQKKQKQQKTQQLLGPAWPLAQLQLPSRPLFLHNPNSLLDWLKPFVQAELQSVSLS